MQVDLSKDSYRGRKLLCCQISCRFGHKMTKASKRNYKQAFDKSRRSTKAAVRKGIEDVVI